MSVLGSKALPIAFLIVSMMGEDFVGRKCVGLVLINDFDFEKLGFECCLKHCIRRRCLSCRHNDLTDAGSASHCGGNCLLH